MEAIRELIVKYFALSYESKVFGNVGRHPRAVNPTITCFSLAVILTGFLDPGVFLTLLLWIPFAVCAYLGFFYFRSKPISYAEVKDWEQKYQFLNKPEIIGAKDETFPKGALYNSEFQKYLRMYGAKYLGAEGFVEAKRIIYPFAVIIVTGILYWISQ